MRTLAPPWRSVLIGSWIMIAVLSVVFGILYIDNKRTRGCIANYMVADQRNTQARATLQEQERQAFLGTLQAIFDPKGTPESRATAGREYIQLVERNNELRKQSPVLPVPTECD